MKTKFFAILASVVAISTWTVGCQKPAAKPNCLIGRGLWTTKWTMVDTTDPNGPCSNKDSEMVGINKYQALISSDNPNPPATVAMKPTEFYGVNSATTAAKDRTDFSLGTIENQSEPVSENGHDFCSIKSFSPASETFGGVATTYKWSNMKWLAEATHPGQQFTADLEYTVGSCTAHYKVFGLYGLNVVTGAPQLCAVDADCYPFATDHQSSYRDFWTKALGFDMIGNDGAGFNQDYPLVCDSSPDLATATVESAIVTYGGTPGQIGVTGSCFIPTDRSFPALCKPDDSNGSCQQAASKANE